MTSAGYHVTEVNPCCQCGILRVTFTVTCLSGSDVEAALSDLISFDKNMERINQHNNNEEDREQTCKKSHLLYIFNLGDLRKIKDIFFSSVILFKANVALLKRLLCPL
ncbi:hypothetical protein AMECASPLE_037427 [Ameca splendens]|uniref:Uncharacterized protein n=1 Tax=Ameca splendens TaxID=208324 RepID=A0ABV0Y852_9TELE